MLRGLGSLDQLASAQTALHSPASAGGSRYVAQQRRRVLCIFPPYQRSFGTFHHAYPLLGGVRAFMPPQGLLVIAAYLPQEWGVWFVDENVRPATPADYRWADVVLTSGMHIQRSHLQRINARAHQAGKLTVLGGHRSRPSPRTIPIWSDYGHVTATHMDRTDEGCGPAAH